MLGGVVLRYLRSIVVLLTASDDYLTISLDGETAAITDGQRTCILIEIAVLINFFTITIHILMIWQRTCIGVFVIDLST